MIIIKNCLGRIFHCDQSFLPCDIYANVNSSNKGLFSGCREGQKIHELHSLPVSGKDGEMEVLDLSVRAWLVESSSFVLSERQFSQSREWRLNRQGAGNDQKTEK